MDADLRREGVGELLLTYGYTSPVTEEALEHLMTVAGPPDLELFGDDNFILIS